MVLIIAEKPSLARNIMAGISEKMTKRDGYHIGENYIVTWAFGHLFSLADIEHYTGKTGGRWTLSDLPCFPQSFEFELRKADDKSKVDFGVKKQFGIIESLCNRADVDTIVNAGDADREGEIIVRLCVEKALKANAKKRFMRLWLPDQTPETVKKALLEMKDESEYDNLAGEGLARTYIDWLYGVNLTRYATIKTGKLLRVGRVIAPIVRAIYDRDLEIRNFVPEKYYLISSDAETGGEKIELTSKERFSADKLADAEALSQKYNACDARVISVTSKKDTIFPGKLYSLSTLQNALGEKYKMSMTDSLKIVQKLYEEGYLTYPRTNSEYLATAEKDKMRSILSNIQKLGYPVRFKDSKHIFDDSKIEAHSALTPTYKIPNKEKLSPDENKVYSTVFRRFVAVFCAEDCLCERSEIVIDVGGLEKFTLKGMVILQKGFTKYDDYTKKDKILPSLKEGDTVNIDFKPCEKETTPPKHYTITTLNNYLKNPFKDEKAKAKELEESGEVDDADDYKAIFEGLELGTEATRSGIIDNAKKSGYIELKKDTYKILPGGEHFIESLGRLYISMDKYKTSELGKALKSVYRGEMSVRDSVVIAEREISEVFSHSAETENLVVKGVDTGKYGEIVGICPRCGKNVVRGKTNYGCMGYNDGCDFRVGINICKRDIPISEVRRLLSEGETTYIDGFISKNFKRFRAKLVIRDGAAVFAFENEVKKEPPKKTYKRAAKKASNKNSPKE
jgi:DNA topoisomerase-3